jgi:hypothetical protein
MKTLTLSLATLALSLSFATPGLEAAAAERLSPAKEAKQLRVLSAVEIKRTFGLAAGQRGRQAIEISCAPADSQWCADDFVQACDDHDGGMSTNDDGSVTCSLPQYE